MTPGSPPPAAIRRILVAVDGSGPSLAALATAAALAAHLQAELEALFVEEADLLRLAELPCAQVSSLLLMEAERIDRERMERRLDQQAARAEEAVRRSAATHGLRVSFRAVRGEVAAEILAAAETSDLLTLGKAGYSRLGRTRPGSTLQAALAAGRPLLVVGSRPQAGQGVLIAYDGSEASERALTLAAGLAKASKQRLNVLVLAASPAEAELAAAQVRRQLGQSAGLRIHRSWAGPRAAMAATARRLRPALFVLADERAGQVLEAVNCPLLLVP